MADITDTPSSTAAAAPPPHIPVITPFPATLPPTPPPLTPSPPPVVYVADTHGEDLAALIGGVVGAVLLLFICVLALLLWCLSRHKGSYVTNEMDEDDEEEDIVNNEDDGDDDDEGDDQSDVGLQTREPLRVTEEE